MNHYQRLKDIREDRGLEQSDIAELFQTTQQQISKYENGTQAMNIERYIQFAKYFNVSLDYLCGITDIPKTLNGAPYVVTNKNITFNNNGDGYKFNIKS